MKSELQITFRDVEPTKDIKELISAQAKKLDSFHNQLMGCHVTVEAPHQHQKRGMRYCARINLTVPQGQIVVTGMSSPGSIGRKSAEGQVKKHAMVNAQDKDIRVAINEAFRAAGRRLQDYTRRQRGDTKSHVMWPEGRVSGLFPRQGYGYLTADDGREIYFHRNSVLEKGFPRLKVGTPVKFVEESGEKGPQASSVRVISKPGYREMEQAALAS